MSEKQPMTAAERQRKYRQKNRDDSGYRIDMQVSARTRWDLENLTERYSVTKKELIERLIKEEAIRAGIRFNELEYRIGVDLVDETTYMAMMELKEYYKDSPKEEIVRGLLSAEVDRIRKKERYKR